jgi:hypothetical protein
VLARVVLIRSAMRDRGHVAVVREQEQSLGRLVGRAVDLAQRVAIDEVRLLKIESRDELLAGTARGGDDDRRVASRSRGSRSGRPWWSGSRALSLAARLGVVGAAHVVLGACSWPGPAGRAAMSAEASRQQLEARSRASA